jgi:hypothetical protein
VLRHKLADTMKNYFSNNVNKVITVEQISSKAKVDDDPDVVEEEDSVDNNFEDLPASAERTADQSRDNEIRNLRDRLTLILEAPISQG